MFIKKVSQGLNNKSEVLTYKESEWYIVCDPFEYGMLSNYKKPSISWKECASCDKSTTYDTLQAAMDHVQSSHYSKVLQTTSHHLDDSIAALWVRNDTQCFADYRMRLYIHHLNLVLNPLREVFLKGSEIKLDVATSSSSTHVQLPTALVDAFKNTVLVLITTASSFPAINRVSEPVHARPCSIQCAQNKSQLKQKMLNSSKLQEDRKLLDDTHTRCLAIAKVAKGFIKDAQNNFGLVMRTDMDTDTVSYDRVGPEYILATVITSLHNRPLYEDKTTDLAYFALYRTLVSLYSFSTYLLTNLTFNSNEKPCSIQGRKRYGASGACEKSQSSLMPSPANKTTCCGTTIAFSIPLLSLHRAPNA